MFFVTSNNDADSLELAKKIGHVIDKNTKIPGNKNGINESNPDFMLAVGDDNLILKTFRELGKRQIPLLGIASTQSFLAQSDAANFQQCINLIEKGKYNIFKRARIVAKFN